MRIYPYTRRWSTPQGFHSPRGPRRAVSSDAPASDGDNADRWRQEGRMPFDSLTFIEASRRPLAAHDPAFEIGTDPPATDRLKARPVPRWHSSLHAERVGSTLSVLVRARELIGDEQRWCR